MWRRGDVVYAALVLTALVAETVALAALTIAFLLRRLEVLSADRTAGVLVLSVAVTALALVGLAIYSLGYHHASDLIVRRTSSQIAGWNDRWTRVILAGERAPQGPLPRAAEEALIALRGVLSGAEGDAVVSLLRQTGIAAALIRRLQARRISVRLDALEALAGARVPEALLPLLPLFEEREDVVRVMAARAAAHTLAAMPEGAERAQASRTFAQALRDAQVAPGVLAEALLLVEDAAPEVLLQLFAPPAARAVVRRSALDAIGRLGLLELAPVCADSLADADAEVRAAALRALARIGSIPTAATPAVLAAIDDPVDFVRVQATRTVGRIAGPQAQHALWARLGDSSWWVRLGAAQALLTRGSEGEEELRRAVREHPDKYGRELAAQVWADRQALLAMHQASRA